MWISVCRLCTFEWPMDDVVLLFKSGQCICLLCFHRQAESEKSMPAWYRREVEHFVNAEIKT